MGVSLEYSGINFKTDKKEEEEESNVRNEVEIQARSQRGDYNDALRIILPSASVITSNLRLTHLPQSERQKARCTYKYPRWQGYTYKHLHPIF